MKKWDRLRMKGGSADAKMRDDALRCDECVAAWLQIFFFNFSRWQRSVQTGWLINILILLS